MTAGLNNTPPWDIRLYLFPGADATDPANWGVAVDASAYLRRGSDGGQAITYSGGQQDESATADPGVMNLTLDNRTGIWSTDNVQGAYYGLLDIGTPIMMGVVAGSDSFTRTASAIGTSTTGQTYTTSGGGAWSTNGSGLVWTAASANLANLATMDNSGVRDFDATVTITAPAAVTTGAAMVAALATKQDVSNYILFELVFNPANDLDVQIVRVGGAGSSTLANVNPSFTYTASAQFKMRAQRIGPTYRVKVWQAASAEPAAWNATATDSSIKPGDVGVLAWRFTGNTNAGSLTVGFDDLLIIGWEFIGSVNSWPLRWDKTGANSWAPIQASGILMRLRQGGSKLDLQSPLYRQLHSLSYKSGYWPLEDATGSTRFATDVLANQPAYYDNITPGATDGPAGGGVAAVLGSGTTGVVVAKVAKPNGGTGFSVMWLAKLQALPPALANVLQIRTVSGPATFWEFYIAADGTFSTKALDIDRTVLSTASSLPTFVDPLQWVAYQLETEIVGANTTWSMIWHQVGSTTYYAQTGSFASTAVPKARQVRLGSIDGMAIAHLWVGTNDLPFVTDTFSQVSGGYDGETASARVARVATEAGIPLVVESGTSEALGVQKSSTSLDVIQQAVDADFAILAEQGTGLYVRPRSARYNRAVDIALSVASGHLDEAPEPVRDDQKLVNVYTATRDSGSSASYQNDASVSRSGRRPGSGSFNVHSDASLPYQASWRVGIGTQAGLRWPRVRINLSRSAPLVAVWRKRPIAPRLTIATGLTQVQGKEPDLIVNGFQASLDPENWTADLNCSAAGIWDVAVANDSTQRADTAGSTIGAVTSSATTLVVTTATGPTWTTSAASYPVDVNVEGERITLSSAPSGSTSPQTFTGVTRAVNGISKSHAAGAAISLWKPAIAAL